MLPVANLDDKFGELTELWSPRIVAEVSGMEVKIARIDGQFIWHAHPETDELFYVHKGAMTMLYRDHAVALGRGDIHVVPAGTEHCPEADGPCEIVMIERAGTLNTGDAGGPMTKPAEPI
ncbi:MAG: cupin domain-containing protein [Pseudomonadota bacterium]